MKKILACLSLALIAVCLPAAAGSLDRAAPEDLGFSPQRLQRLSAALEHYVDSGQIAGSVTIVARHGKVAYLKAFGERDRASHSPMKVDSIFRIASQTKAIVTTAAMILQEQGKLLIQDPVSKYIPEFAHTTVAVPKDGGGYDVVPAERPITIRDLMTHTSGYDYGDGIAADRWKAAGIEGYYLSNRDETIGELAAKMASLPASAQPGEKWIYGYSIDILGAVVEKAAGMPLDEFLERQIFQPLDMKDTYFFLPPAKRDRLATVYANVDGKLELAPEDGWNGQGKFVDGPRKCFSGGAGLVSTAMDYARFLQMILNEGELDGHRILGRKTVELMSVDHLHGIPFNPGEGFGLGFDVLKDLGARGMPGSVGELGWGGAYHSEYWIDPVEDMVVVHLTQLIPAGDVDDHTKVRALVYQAIAD
jgi:CubicO group peptidase (beta-lactamase class C family)